MSQVTFDPHAERRMNERRISLKQVLNTLNNPDETYPSHSGRMVAERKTKLGNTLRVVYEELAEGIYVWTVIRISPR